MAITWRAQACDLRHDADSGAQITRLTASVMSNINLYFEQPYGTPDGRRIAYARAIHEDPRCPPTELCVADLESLRIASIDTDIVSTWFATSSWSGKLHYLRSNGELIRVDLTTLDKEIVITHFELPPPINLWSVTPDMHYLIASRTTEDFHTHIIRVNLDTGRCETIYQRRNIMGHMQINHVTGRDILVQVNRGRAMNHLRHVDAFEEEYAGATHILIDIESGKERTLPIGEPHTGSTTGHATWVGDTGRIATPVHWPSQSVDFQGAEQCPPHDPRHPKGNMIIVGPDDTGPTAFEAPEHLFIHASSSRCGRYFVADSITQGIPGPIAIVVGNFETGQYRALVSDCGASMGGPACSHVHPYFTADSRNVIYNSDATGVGHVHAARVPDGFLKSLDADLPR